VPRGSDEGREAWPFAGIGPGAGCAAGGKVPAPPPSELKAGEAICENLKVVKGCVLLGCATCEHFRP
jgi:hypothetical protein